MLSVHLIFYVGVLYGFYFLLSGSDVIAVYTYGVSTIGLAPLQFSGACLSETCVPPGVGLWPIQECTE